MTKCVEFFELWKKEPNFCGVGKATCRAIEKYIDFVDEYTKQRGMSTGLFYKNAPMSAIKPLLRFRKDSDIRKKAVEEISNTLQNKQAITKRYVESLVGLDSKPKKFVKDTIDISSVPPTPINSTVTITDKIRLLNGVLSTGQMNILSDVMKENALDNEYESLCLVLKWAAERIEK